MVPCPRILIGALIVLCTPQGSATPGLAEVPGGALAQAVREARDRVFPTLVHIRPVLDLSSGGQKTETLLNGSGVIISADGLVVTNFHVAGLAKRMICTLADRRALSAELIGSDAATDLALIRLNLDELGLERIGCAEFGSLDNLEVGDFVMTMGFLMGLTRSLSLGVVSCRDRYLPPMTVAGHVPTGLFNTWIQTDAAINPGNSGGPLVDLTGRVVGINTRGYRGAENLGFAIPGDVVREVVSALEERGRVLRSELGLSFQPLKEMTDLLSEARGLLVASVVAGSPAHQAGILAGDVLLRYDGQPLSAVFDEELPEARRRIAATVVGQTVPVVVSRKGAQQEFELTTVAWQEPAEQDLELEHWGLTLRELSHEERRQRFLTEGPGVLITGVRKGGPAAHSRPKLLAGDVLLSVAGVELTGPEQVRDALSRTREAGGKSVVLEVIRGRSELLIALPVDHDQETAQGDRP